jgi:predicted secreted hydrolase
MPKQQDDFQRAAATARAEAGDDWFEMPFREQAHAIYAQLRQIDAARALTMNTEAEGRRAALEAWAA